MEWENLFDNVPVIYIEEQNMDNEYKRFKDLISKEPKEEKEEDQDAFIGTANYIATIRNRSFRIEERNKIKDENNWKKIGAGGNVRG